MHTRIYAGHHEMMAYFVENLTLWNWFLVIMPRLLRERMKRADKYSRCYIIDGSPFTISIAKASAWIAGAAVEKLAFRLVEVRDEVGLLILCRIACWDLAEVQADAMEEPAFREFLQSEMAKGRLTAYLAKSIASISSLDPRTLWRALLLVQVCVWKTRDIKISGGDAVLFLERRPWIGAIRRYASRFGVTIVPVTPTSRSLRALLDCLIGAKGIQLLRMLRDGLHHRRLFYFGKLQRILRAKPMFPRPVVQPASGAWPSTPQVGVEYYGHLNLNQPECQSDLSFWQQSSLSGSDILVTFALPHDPLDEKKWAELREYSVKAIALHPRATTLASVPLFQHRPQLGSAGRNGLKLKSARKSLEEVWLREQVSSYLMLREYWTDLFASQNVRLYVSWYRYDMTHCAIADAMQCIGGVTAIYQRAFQPEISPDMSVASDIMFGYSPADADVERRSNSMIQYHVAVGYLGDHRFPMLRESAQRVRDQLRRHGAEHVLAYFDENSHDEERWLHGHTITRESYAFLLGKVLAEPRLGLVFKPKVPSTLRARLGPVAELLERAEATGRCYVYEGGALHGSWPPAAAALAADVAIHGHLVAATAGLEAALAGVPTLLMDREGWPSSPLYSLGVGRVVFTDWEMLWEAFVRHRSRPGGVPGFGDWSPILVELDPFRDGRAAERMGTYIKWLIEGFKASLDRETVMANAAERYCELWGKDKVTAVNSRSWPTLDERYEAVGLSEIAKSYQM